MTDTAVDFAFVQLLDVSGLDNHQSQKWTDETKVWFENLTDVVVPAVVACHGAKVVIGSWDPKFLGINFWKDPDDFTGFYNSEMACFICHSGKDARLATQVDTIIKGKGMTTFLDYNNLDDETDDTIAIAIDNCDVFLMILTRNSETCDYCMDELAFARKLDKRIIVVEIGKWTAKRTIGLRTSRKVTFQVESEQQLEQKMPLILKKLEIIIRKSQAAKADDGKGEGSKEATRGRTDKDEMSTDTLPSSDKQSESVLMILRCPMQHIEDCLDALKNSPSKELLTAPSGIGRELRSIEGNWSKDQTVAMLTFNSNDEANTWYENAPDWQYEMDIIVVPIRNLPPVDLHGLDEVIAPTMVACYQEATLLKGSWKQDFILINFWRSEEDFMEFFNTGQSNSSSDRRTQ